MEVTELSVNTFWKGEMELKGTVKENGELYRVRILSKGSQIYDYSCSHVDQHGSRTVCSQAPQNPGTKTAVSVSGLCPHARALFEEWERRQTEAKKPPVSTSPRVRFMIREYTNREVSRILGAEEMGSVSLIPHISVSGGRVQAGFSVWRGKEFPIRDLADFAEKMESGAYGEYGKGFGFHHSLDAFEEKDRPLALFLMERAAAYREQYLQASRNAAGLVPPLKELTLGRAARERLFTLLEGRKAEFEVFSRERRTLEIKRENPDLEICVERAGKDGLRLSIDRSLFAFHGENGLFIGNREALYFCGRDYTRALTVLMEYTVMDPIPEYEITVNDRDVPLFYERVLKRLELLKLLKVRDVDLEAYRPEELKARFYFDSPSPGIVLLKPELSYGDYSFHPLADENVPKEICRDVPGEFLISRLVTEYFKMKEDGTGNLVIREDDDAIYRLLSVGIPRFMELGEVFISDALKKIRLLPSAGASVQIHSRGRLLDLSVDLGGIPREELKQILTAYERKRPYYRMKNGDFLTLGEGGLWTVSRLAKELEAEKEFLDSGQITLPMYRALFLDGALKEDRSIPAYRDRLFKTVVRGMKDVEDSDFELPARLVPILRGYQKAGFRWLKTLDSYGFGGILADEMGLGKTIQVIALLLDQKLKEGGQSFIVCPASLIYNWESEFQNFAPEICAKVIAGTQEEREAALKECRDHPADVLITSYDLLKRDIGLYQEMEFRFHIIDEAQYIKNAATQAAKAVKAVRSVTRFALTGTPIENHLGELWSIFDFLMPGFLFTAAKFKKRFESPVMREGDPEALALLKKLTGPFILRRLKKDVLKELPDKLETVLYSSMEGEQKKLYAAGALKLKEALETPGELEARERMQILADLMSLRQLCCDPSLCYSNYKGGSAKLETCMELLQNGTAAGHKILLFSQFTSMLSIIEKRLKKEKLDYYMLTGATPAKERMQMAAAFKRDQVPIFLISLKAGGTGLNLEAADMVILYDPWWNAAAESQAADRAHRIGQENQVTVFKLITKHTIEENILKLQEQKRMLADSVVAGVGGSFAGLTKEELLKVLGE